MAEVRFEKLRKTFGGSVAVDGLDLVIADGEFVSLLGPSGCGKTTTLRMLAGLEFPTSGTIAIGTRVVNDLPPAQRNIAMVFQSYALYPHMSVAGNIAYPLKKRGVPRAERDLKVREVAATLQLTEYLDRKPRQLSGGQQQRVALGRALVRDPDVFLLDEPLSNLDAKLRAHMRAELIELHQRIGKTFVYVTHDQLEAMTMSDRIAVMHRGVLQQVGAPTEVYERPANLFVAGFIGTPSMNLLPVKLERIGSEPKTGQIPFSSIKEVIDRDWDPVGVFGVPAAAGEYNGYAVRIAVALMHAERVDQLIAELKDIEASDMGITECSSTVDAAEKLWALRDIHGAGPLQRARIFHPGFSFDLGLKDDQRAITEFVLGIRPEDVLVGQGDIKATVRIVEPTGHETITAIDIAGDTLVVRTPPETRLKPGERIRVAFKTQRLHLFDKSSERRLNARFAG